MRNPFLTHPTSCPNWNCTHPFFSCVGYTISHLLSSQIILASVLGAIRTLSLRESTSRDCISYTGALVISPYIDDASIVATGLDISLWRERIARVLSIVLSAFLLRYD